MKRLTILFALSFVLLSFGLSYALDFGVVVDPSYQFDPPYITGTDMYVKANNPVVMQLQVGNSVNPSGSFLGGTMAIQFYGTGDVTAVTYDNGPSNVTEVDGLVDFWGGQWEAGNFFYVNGWDGALPDTFSHSMLSFAGWNVGEPMATKYELHFNIDQGFTDESGTGMICLDSCNHPTNDQFQWLFAAEDAEFITETCFPVAFVTDLPPVVDCGALPTQMITEHDVAFSLTGIPVSDPDGEAVTGVTASVGTVTFNGDNFDWSYDPPCSEVGASLSVEFFASNVIDGPACSVDLVVNNTAPVITGDCGENKVYGVNSTASDFSFDATDANAGDSKTFSIVSVEPNSGDDHTVTIDGSGDVTINTGAIEGAYTVTVQVEDCAGATDECTFTFSVVGELPFVIAIEKDEGTDPNVEGAYQGQHTFVDVTLIEGSEEIHGFDFLIAYDNSALAFTGAYMGQALIDAEWEYFTYRYGADGNCSGGCPSGLLRVVAIADQNDGVHHPNAVTFPTNTVLFSLDFLVSNNNTFECQFVPVSFFFMDCGDNSLAFRKATWEELDVRQAIASAVYGYNGMGGYLIDPPTEEPFFPGFSLDTMQCMTETNPLKLPVPFMTLYNGGVDIACNDEIDDRGDINLNGNAYEIADAVVLTNYFLYGMAAFTINEQGQIAASDVNADGIKLSVGDLVYLIRVVVGDALPYPKVSPVATPAEIGQFGNALTVDSELGAVAFAVEGEVLGLGSDATNMELKTVTRDGMTYGVIYSFEPGATFSGEFLNIEGRLASIEGATYDGATMKFVNLPTSFEVKNYPNPFNPATTIEMGLPIASNWKLDVYNIAGQKVKEFNGYSEAGTVKVVFDASDYASGIYFYKFQAGTKEITKKMVLLK